MGLLAAGALVLMLVQQPGVDLNRELARRAASITSAWPTLLSAVLVCVAGIQLRIAALAREADERRGEAHTVGRVLFYMALAPILAMVAVSFAAITTAAAIASHTNTALIVPIWVFALLVTAVCSESAALPPRQASMVWQHDRDERLRRLRRAAEQWPPSIWPIRLQIAHVLVVALASLALGYGIAIIADQFTPLTNTAGFLALAPISAIFAGVMAMIDYVILVGIMTQLINRSLASASFLAVVLAGSNISTGLLLVGAAFTPRGLIVTIICGTTLLTSLVAFLSQVLLRHRWITRTGILSSGVSAAASRWIARTTRSEASSSPRHSSRVRAWYDSISGM